MSLSSSIPRPSAPWMALLLLALGLWVGWACAIEAQGTKGRDKVEKLSPAERDWLEQQSKALHDLPPEEQQRVRKNLRRWVQLPEEQRTQLRERWQEWQQLPPEQRQRLQQRYEEFQRLPVEERQRLREDLRRLSPEER